jgi:hypothetical protein
LKDLEKEPWVAAGFLKELNHYQHCELLLKEVGTPLSDFESSLSVTNALLCAVKGMFCHHGRVHESPIRCQL